MCNVKTDVDEPATREYRMRARQDAVAATRERILGAAYELWAERPYDQVSIGAIAKSAGVSRQTVIRQFGTKDELAFAVVDWQKPHESAFRAAEAGDIEGAIARLVDRYETMGDANVRVLEMSGRVPAIDYLLEVSRAGHFAWIEQTLLSGAADDRSNSCTHCTPPPTSPSGSSCVATSASRAKRPKPSSSGSSEASWAIRPHEKE